MAVLYVDESGEEGFSPTSSEWLILGAVLHHEGMVREILAAYADFKSQFRKEESWYFHFVKKTHHERLGFIRHMVAAVPYRAFAVAIHKPSIRRPENFQKKYYLYFYALRFLLERATNWCDSNNGMDLVVKLSARGGLSANNVVEYLARVQDSPFVTKDNMKWDYLFPDAFECLHNKELIGLQMADCVASSVSQALEYSEYSTLECRYIRELSPYFCCDRGSLQSRILIWPSQPGLNYQDGQRLAWLTIKNA